MQLQVYEMQLQCMIAALLHHNWLLLLAQLAAVQGCLQA
jgi:hypothetical protein